MGTDEPARPGGARLETMSGEPPRGNRIEGWCVHLLTASSAIFDLLALEAIAGGRLSEALLWMTIPVAIDSVDGTLARRMRLDRLIPEIDGALLDNLVDFVTYCFVPAWFLMRSALLPDELCLVGAGAICLASGYQFAHVRAKTDDHFFRGFPSYWNILVVYLHVLGLRPTTNLAVVLLLAVAVFLPLKFVYPSRTVPWQRLTLALTLLWAASVAGILLTLPTPPAALVWGSLGYVVYYLGASFWLGGIDRSGQPGPPSSAAP